MKKVFYPRYGNAGITQPMVAPRLLDSTDPKASRFRAGRMGMGMVALLLLLMMGTLRPALSAPQDSDTKNLVPDSSEAEDAVKGLGAKHALLIGNHKYDNSVWEEVPTVPKELAELAKALTAAGFQLYERKIHYNLNLPDLRNLMRDFITNLGVGRSAHDSQLLIFFSGHGHNVQNRGYIVPSNAPGTSPDEDAFVRGAIPFNEIESLAKTTDARHLLFAFDSCFSGDLFDFRSANEPSLPGLPLAMAKIAASKARQFMTAGKAGEKVPARSQFTPFFTKGLKGEADADRNGYVTAHELFAFLQPRVAAKTKNTPRFAPLPGAEYEGDFVFCLPQPVAKPPPVAVENLSELFQGSALASAVPEQQRTELKKVQAALFRAQLYDGAVDGMMGQVTVAAIRTWQRQHNLPDSGRLDAATLATFSSPGETPVAIGSATKDKPFINSLGIPLVPVRGTQVLFATWETRVGDYLLFAEQAKRPWERPEFPQTNTHPVVNVTWDDAVEFCRWLSVREGVTYRLPMGNEWSLATGADSGPEGLPLYPWGDEFPPTAVTANIADRAAWNVTKPYLPEYEDGFAQTAPVGRMRANGHGISDLGGNVWEWCAEASAQEPGENPEYYCKGGSWREGDVESLLTHYRLTKKADERSDTIGFRMVLEVPPPRANADPSRAEAVARRMLALAASYAEAGVGREDTPNLVSSFLALFDLPLKQENGHMVPYCGVGVAYVATRAYLELEAEAEPDKPIDTEALRAALPKVRDLLFCPSPVIRVMKADAQERGSWEGSGYANPKPGWLAVYSWKAAGGDQPNHVGIVESSRGGQLTTIEFSIENDQKKSGAVARRTRDLKYALGYIKTY